MESTAARPTLIFDRQPLWLSGGEHQGARPRQERVGRGRGGVFGLWVGSPPRVGLGVGGRGGGGGGALPLTAHHFNRYLLPIPSGVSP